MIIIAEVNVSEREEGIQKERNTICIMLIIQGGGRVREREKERERKRERERDIEREREIE